WLTVVLVTGCSARFSGWVPGGQHTPAGGEVPPSGPAGEPAGPGAGGAGGHPGQGRTPEDEHPGVPTSPTRASLASVGDVLLHNTLINAGREPGSGTYVFRHYLVHVRDAVRAADLAV